MAEVLISWNVDFNLLAYLDAQVGKQNFKELLGIEPRIVSSEEFPRDIPPQLELEISKCEEKTRILRLMCLLSVTYNGLPKDVYNALFKEFVEAFGTEELLRLLNMERTGILHREHSAPISWKALREAFKLIEEDVHIEKPTTISYTYNGYAPLSVRLVERLLDSAWTTPEGTPRLLSKNSRETAWR